MFNAIKEFFIGVLITVGIVSTPTSVPPQEIFIPEPEIAVQEQEAEQPVELSTEKPRTIQNESQNPVQQITPQQAVVETPVASIPTPDSVVIEEIPKPVIETRNGQCGNAANKRVTEQPTTNLCIAGNPSEVSKNGSSYTWNCLGVGGGKDSISCRTPIITDGICGSLANTIVPQNYERDDLCTAGFAGSVQTVGNQLQWSCGGEYGGKNVQCYATKALTQADVQQQAQQLAPTQQQTSLSTKTNGVCGNAQNSEHVSAPSNYLCSSGTPTTVQLSSDGKSFIWSCSGISGGSSSQCNALKICYSSPSFSGSGPTIFTIPQIIPCT